MKRILRLWDHYALIQYKFKHLKVKYFSLLAVSTIMCLEAVQQVSAQGAEPAVTAIQLDNIKPLQIGDTIPEYLWHLPLQVVNHPEGLEAITLNDYRNKLIILDFWGTFCGACITAMPEINEVQQQFANEMVVIPVSRSKPDMTEEALQNHRTLQPLGLFSVVEAKALINLFPHGVIPHYVWIDPRGEVVATTASNDVSGANVAMVLHGERPDYTLKTYINTDQPLFFAADGIPEGAGLQQYSIFIKGEIPSLSGGTKARKTGNITNGYSMYNRPLVNMYQIIASKIKGDSIVTMGGVGKKRFVEVDPIEDVSKCTFDFIIPPGRADSLYVFMLASLNQHSGYTGRWVKRMRPCLVLTRTGANGGFIGNAGEQSFRNDSQAIRLLRCPISQLVSRLNWHDISKDRLVFNETGYNGEVDITFYAPFDDFANVRKQLQAQGLDLVEKEREIEIFEITKQ